MESKQASLMSSDLLECVASATVDVGSSWKGTLEALVGNEVSPDHFWDRQNGDVLESVVRGVPVPHSVKTLASKTI
jgi:hypothetical protein